VEDRTVGTLGIIITLIALLGEAYQLLTVFVAWLDVRGYRRFLQPPRF